MLNYFDQDTLARTYRDPVAMAILVVDLFPIYAVLAFGWDASALVFLYWLENLVIGAVTLARMTAVSARQSPVGLIQMAFLGPFFIVHFGMFCFVHGQFLNMFANAQGGPPEDNIFLSPWGLVMRALDSGAHMPAFLFAIIALQAYLFGRDFMLGEQYKSSDVHTEMGAPYGRVIVLHIALFVGMAAMIALGQPMIGVLALILLRAAWGVLFTVRRRISLDAAALKS
ncbi:MAG: DUF6498-containing protein [Pseudomonadota bacterium]